MEHSGAAGQDPAEELYAAARRVRIVPAMLGYDEEITDPHERANSLRRAQLLAGCLHKGAVILIDELFEDIATLSTKETITARDIDQTNVLWALPPRFAHRYDVVFARRFLFIASDLTTKLTGNWSQPSCVAQELATRCLLNQTEVIADAWEAALDPHWRSFLDERLFEDADHEFLYDRQFDGFEDDPDWEGFDLAPMKFDDWFEPFNDDRPVPPYATSN